MIAVYDENSSFKEKLLDEYGKQYDGLKISKGTDEFMEQLVH